MSDKLLLVPGECLPMWYIVEREDGAPVSDADVEGSLSDLLCLAAAIRGWYAFEERRCACVTIDCQVLLWSPRNSTHAYFASTEAAQDLAAQIEAECEAKGVRR